MTATVESVTVDLVVVDTNVAVVANHRFPHASPACILACVERLLLITQAASIAIDDGWRMISEYRNQLNEVGQPGVGDLFLKWVLVNRTNPHRCQQVSITNRTDSTDPTDFIEFPNDPELVTFDRSDRKFVAVAMAHPDHPPILNAVDSDWWNHRQALEKQGIVVHFLC